MDGVVRAAYPAGEGGDAIEAALKSVLDVVEELAEAYHGSGQRAIAAAGEMRSTKHSFLIALAWLALQLVYAAFLGPGAPFAQAWALGATQAVSRLLGGFLLHRLEALLGKAALSQAGRLAVKFGYETISEGISEVVEDRLQQALNQFAKIVAGYQDGGFDWGALGENLGVPLIAGGAGGAAGHGLHGVVSRLPGDHSGWVGMGKGAVTGGGAGAAGASAAYVVTGLSSGVWEFDPRMLTSSVISGAGPSAIYGWGGRSNYEGGPMADGPGLPSDGTSPKPASPHHGGIGDGAAVTGGGAGAGIRDAGAKTHFAGTHHTDTPANTSGGALSTGGASVGSRDTGDPGTATASTPNTVDSAARQAGPADPSVTGDRSALAAHRPEPDAKNPNPSVYGGGVMDEPPAGPAASTPPSTTVGPQGLDPVTEKPTATPAAESGKTPVESGTTPAATTVPDGRAGVGAATAAGAGTPSSAAPNPPASVAGPPPTPGASTRPGKAPKVVLSSASHGPENHAGVPDPVLPDNMRPGAGAADPGTGPQDSPGPVQARLADSELASAQPAEQDGPLAELIEYMVEEADFPFPRRLETWAPNTEEAVQKGAELREFARWMANKANTIVNRLRHSGRKPTPEDWEAEYWDLIEERSKVRGYKPNARLKLRLTDAEYPNVNRFSSNAERDGSVLDPRIGRWVGGLPTPFSELWAETCERALARFDTGGVTGEELQNKIRLSDGTVINGNRILKGKAAEEILHFVWEAKTSPNGWEFAPGDVITVSGTEANRRRILHDAFEQLARPGEFTVETWADVAYKLFQAPQTKSGSDATIRTFLVGAAAYRLGRVPDFPHDIDLRAMTMNQGDFVRYVVDHDARAYSKDRKDPTADTGAIGIRDRPTDPQGPGSASPSGVSPLRRLSTLSESLDQLGRDVASQLIVVGSTGMHAAFGVEALLRASADIDVLAPIDIVNYFRGRPGWEFSTLPDGTPIVKNGDFDIMGVRLGEEGSSYDEVRGDSYTIADGRVTVAGLHRIYSRKEWRVVDDLVRAKDVADMDMMKSLLLNRDRPPLPRNALERQIRMVMEVMPEWLLGHPMAQSAVHLAANAGLILETLYGADGIEFVNLAAGSFDVRASRVPMTYHNGRGFIEPIRMLFHHLDFLRLHTNIKVTPEHYLIAMVADLYSDGNYNDGREKDNLNNPAGHDEAKSASLARAHALSLGWSKSMADLLYECIANTAFDQHTGTQKGRHHPHFLVRAISAIDLQGLSRFGGLRRAGELGPEDLAARRAAGFHQQILSRALVQTNTFVRNAEEAYLFIQKYSKMRPIMDDGAPSSKTLGEALAGFYIGNGIFMDPAHEKGYKYPDEWPHEHKQVRAAHAEESVNIGTDLLAGKLKPDGVLERIDIYENGLRRRFPEFVNIPV
ncbi:hypothetical protein OH799_14730 [Nocardia sp. NBC_00881]|uniref:hypothetical protein n=1 Tax=Nocardia sp. NBC_00881 TaxID=2975995 RepID=UPI00386EA746|nr:hypothetical protein OH799_14730 [Nocardia sp. NBC_00881]